MKRNHFHFPVVLTVLLLTFFTSCSRIHSIIGHGDTEYPDISNAFADHISGKIDSEHTAQPCEIFQLTLNDSPARNNTLTPIIKTDEHTRTLLHLPQLHSVTELTRYIPEEDENGFWWWFFVILLILLIPFMFPGILAINDDGQGFTNEVLHVLYVFFMYLAMIAECAAIILLFFFPLYALFAYLGVWASSLLAVALYSTRK
ncbi:MAG TPA: hypothetical protein VL651_05810 [Bacteroidia bacterium]|jgi:hypothetical protein|nr:hypothetical protein [Bacteroidia bacterium]